MIAASVKVWLRAAVHFNGRDLQSLYRCHVTAHVMLPSFPLMSTLQGLLSCKLGAASRVLYCRTGACRRSNIKWADSCWPW